jgi:hypothetical protein
MHGPNPDAAVDVWRYSQESGMPLRPNFRDNFRNIGVRGG